jgi:hypothetical protein
MLYVYAIVSAGAEVRDAETLTCGEVAAAFRESDERSIAPTAENVAAHARVVDALAAHGPALPARFGTTFLDLAALHESLARHHDGLVAGLDRVSGCAEMGVRALWQRQIEEPSREVHTGRDYMLARVEAERRRQEHQRAAEELVKSIHPPLAELARDATHRVLPSPDTPLVASYLVPRDDVIHFKRRAAQLDDAHGDVALICTGPWPPYHFAPPLDRQEAARA